MRALRIFRIFGIILGVLVLLVAGALISGYFYVQSPSGRESLAGLVSDLASTPGVSEITIGEIGAGLPARLALADVVMRDRDGVWLSADRVLLTWKPSALFSRQLHVTALEAGGIDVVRAPVPADQPEEPEPDETGFTMPSLPVSVRVDRLQIADLTLGQAFAGERMTLQAEGMLAAPRDGAIRTDLAVRRTDEGGGITIDVAGAFDPSTEQLTVDVRAREPADGLVMRLAGLQPYPPFSLGLTGDGPLADWKGKLNVNGEDLFAVNADIGIAKGEDLAVRLTGSADIAGLVQDPVRTVVGDAVSFDVGARYQDPNELLLDTLDIRTAALALTGGGRLDLDTEAISAKLSLDALEPARLSALLQPAALGSVGIDADIAGAVSDPAVNIQGNIGALTAPGLSADTITLDARLAPQDGKSDAEDPGPRTLNVAIDAAGVTSETPATAALLGSSVTVTLQSVLNAAVTAIDIETLEVAAAAVRVNGRGRVGFAEGPTDFTLDGGIDDLAKLGDALQMPLAGSLGLNASLEGHLAASQVTGSASLRFAQFSMGQPVADAVLGPDAAFTTQFALQDEGTAVVESLKLDAKAFGVIGNAQVTEGYSKLAAALQLVVPDLKPIGDAVATPMAGRLVTDVTAEGVVADPTVNVVASLSDATVQDIAVPSAKTTLEATNVVSGPKGLITFVAETSMAAIDAATRFAVEEGERLRLTDIAAKTLGVELSGSMNVPLAGGSYTGDLNAAFRGGDGGVTVAGTTARGSADLGVRLHDDDGKQAASLDLDGSGLAIVPEGGDAIRIGRINAKGTGTDLLGTPSGNMTLNGVDIGTGAVTVGTLDADVSGSAADAQFRVAARLTSEPNANFETRGTVAMADSVITVTIAGLGGAVAEVPFALQRPAAVVMEGETVSVRDVALKVSDGLITLNARQAPAEKTAQLRINTLPLAVARAFAPGLDVAGDVNASADVVTEGALLGGKLDLRVDGIIYGDPAYKDLPPLAARMNARWSGGVVNADGRVQGLGDGDLVMTGRLPLKVDARTMAVNLGDTTPIAAQVNWQGALQPLIEALPIDGHRMSGQGRIDVAASGTIAAPRLQGAVTIANGRYENLEYGTVIGGLDADVRMDPNQPIKVALSGTDGGSGRLSAQGRVPLDKSQGDLDVRVEVRDATLVRRDDVTATLNSDLRFVRGAQLATLTGRIQPTRIEARLVNRMPPSVVDLNPVEIGKDGDVIRARVEPDAGAAVPIDLDLVIDMPGNVFVRGRGLESEWKGNLAVTGPATEPRVKGKIEVVRGEFTFVGTTFDLTKGVVEFASSRKIDPRLDIVAEHKRDDITGIIAVSGLASDPQIELRSIPALPESEVLPRVLFGKSAGELGPGEAAQIALALDSLRTGDSGLVDVGRNLLGVDTLSIDPGSGDGGSAVRAGKNLGERVYIETKQGTKPGTTKYSAEVKITDRLSLEAELSEGTSDTQESIGLKWQWDY